jgi:hypothetical protein
MPVGEPTQHRALRTGGEVPRVGELDRGEFARLVPTPDRRGDLAGVVVDGLVGHALERRVDLETTEAEVLQRLLANDDERVVATLGADGIDGPLGEAQDVGVVSTTHAAVGGDDDECRGAGVRVVAKERMLLRRAGPQQVDDHRGDLVAVRTRRCGTLLGLHDTSGRDQFHGARDLLCRFDALDASTKNPLLATCHD